VRFLTSYENNFLYDKFTSYEIILVNDNSTDETVNRAFEVKDLVKGNVTIVDLKNHIGVGTALNSGTDISIGDLIYEIESILVDYPLEIMLDMYNELSKEGKDIIILKSNEKPRLIRRIYNNLIKWLSNNKIDPISSKIRLVTRRALYSVTKDKNIITDRCILYKNSQFDWTNKYYLPVEKSINNENLLNRLSKDIKSLMIHTKVFNKLPFLLSLIFFIFSIVNLLLKSNFKLGVSLISLGFSSILIILGLLYSKLDIILNKDIKLDYKVKSITRINRY